MLVRLGKLLVIATLVATTGAHWALLQSVAWTTMLADNLRTQSLSLAVAQTFDGDHPCPLCKAIAAGKKSERKTEITGAAPKLEYPPFTENAILVAPRFFQVLTVSDSFAQSISQKPPVPPPRPFFV
ncbi:MAG TPA: hypothetical protein VGO57_11585 [Verrucomicrobiae bacterium]|jgi:hypothetical protein